MPAMPPEQAASWSALLDLHEDVPDGWTLVGGQMVHLWCAEREASFARPTDDGDAVLDVRARPQILQAVTSALHERGFDPVTSNDGVQHRWVREGAKLDLLIPRHLGEYAANKKGVGGGRTIATPGAQKVLNRSENVRIEVEGRLGTIRRPTLVGALIGKSAAFTVPLDGNKDRHLGDLVTLASLITPEDFNGVALDSLEERYLANGIGQAVTRPEAWTFVPNGTSALARLQLAVARMTRSARAVKR